VWRWRRPFLVGVGRLEPLSEWGLLVDPPPPPLDPPPDVLGGVVGVLPPGRLGTLGTDGTEGGVVGTALPISWISVPGSGTSLAGMLAGTSTVTRMIEPVASLTSKVGMTADAGREANTNAPAANAAASSANRSRFLVIRGFCLLPKGSWWSRPGARSTYQTPAREQESYWLDF
jgi:hypothetical protein